MQCSFKSDRKKLQTKRTFMLSFIFTYIVNFIGKTIYFFLACTGVTVQFSLISASCAPFSVSFREGLLEKILTDCFFSQHALISLSFWGIVLLIESFLDLFFPFQDFEYVFPLSSDCHGFRWRISLCSYWGSFVHDE